jgi:hypothetical protein
VVVCELLPSGPGAGGGFGEPERAPGIEWIDFAAVTRSADAATASTPDSARFYWNDPKNWELLSKAIHDSSAFPCP